MNINTNKLWFGFAILVSLIGSLFVFNIQDVSAANSLSSMSAKDQAKSYSYYSSMKLCIERNRMHRNIDTKDNGHTNPANWEYQGETIHVGYLIGDGKQSCKDVYIGAMKFWDISPSTLLQSMGYVLNTSGTTYEYSGSSSDQAKDFSDTLKKKIGDNPNGYEQTESNLYYLYAAVFSDGCKATPVGELSSQTDEIIKRKAESGSDGYTTTRTVSASGMVSKETIYKINPVSANGILPGGSISGNGSRVSASSLCSNSIPNQIKTSALAIAPDLLMQEIDRHRAGFLKSLEATRNSECEVSDPGLSAAVAECKKSFDNHFNSCFNGHINDTSFTYPDYDVAVLAYCLATKRGTTPDNYLLALSGSAEDIKILETDDGTGAISGTASDEPTTCVVDGIGWMVCPVLNAFAGLGDLMYGWIEDILKINPLTDTDDKGEDTPQYTAWKNIRDLANVILVIGFIIIIFSQLTGMGVSNYGVKKTLPRLVIIAIAINVSFFIMALAVDLTNIIGVSIQEILSNLAPSGSAETIHMGDAIASFATGTVATTALVGVTAIGAATGAHSLSALALMALPVIAVAILGLLAAFATLFLRNALVIILIVISPLAIAAYLLPNTQDLFNKWRKLFVSMLVLFPMAALLFAGSQFVAMVTLTSPGPLSALIAIFIMAAPLGMLPFLIKSSNSLLANIGGKMMGMAQKARNPLSKAVDPYVKNQQEKYRAGQRNFLGMKQRPGKENRAQRSFARRAALEKETANMTAEAMEQLRENAANPRTNKKGAPLKSDLRLQSALDGEQTLATRKAANDSTFKTRSDQRKATTGTADNTFNVRAEDNAIESASYADRMEADRSRRVLTSPKLATFDNASKEAKLSTALNEAEGQRRFDDRVANNTGLTDTLQATRRAQEASKVMGIEQDLRFEQDRGVNPSLRNLAQRQADAELKIDHAKSETSMTTKSSQASNIGLQDVKLATEANKRAGGLLDKEFEQVVAEASTSAGAANLVAQGYDAGTVDAVRTTATQTSVVSAAIDSAASVQRGEYAEELRANSSMQAAAAGIDPHGEPRVVAQAIESQRKAHDGNVAAYGVQIRENGTPSDTLLLNVEDTSLPVAAREAAGRALVDGGDIEKIKPYMDYLATALATAATPEDAEAVKYLQKAFAERINSSPGKPMGIGAGDIAAMTQGTYSTPSPVPSIGSMPMTKEASDLLLGTGGVAPSASLIQTYNTVVEKGVSPEGWATMDKNDITAITELIQAGAMPASRIDTMKESLRKSRKDDRINNRIKERERDLLNNLEKLL